MSRTWVKVAAVCAAAIILVFGYWLLSTSSFMESVHGGEALDALIEGLGLWGPLLIVGLIATAIVVSPIPSAPIALAAGAAYGHFWGTAYVLAGAEVGALIAFGLARVLGYDLVRTWFGNRLDVGLLGSQNVVMATVFLTRLMPFISFDIVSYAAGLTSLAPWRFAVATLAGIIPASFLLAHFGTEMASADTRGIMMAALALGAVTGLPLLGKALWTRHVIRRTRRPLAGADGGSSAVDRD
ncbi:MAG: TVP38/TMEM64 family protein [Kiloniellaceae bacterium]